MPPIPLPHLMHPPFGIAETISRHNPAAATDSPSEANVRAYPDTGTPPHDDRTSHGCGQFDGEGEFRMFAQESTSSVVLPNGLTVMVVQDSRFPLASIRLYVRAGSAYEDAAEAGISHILEHMVFKGTARRGPGEAAREIESIGGYCNAATSFDYTVFMADVPSDHWKTGLDVLQDIVLQPTVDPEELEAEKQVILAELERGEDSPSGRLFRSMQPMLWGGTSYARPIIGTRETVNAVTAQDLHDYIAEYYQPQSMLLVVCGDVDADETIAECRRLFEGMENDRDVAAAPPIPIAEEWCCGPKIRVEQGPWNKAYLCVGFPVPGFRSPDSVGLDVLAALLGGDRTSRYFRIFKYEKQLVDDISCHALTLERIGMLYFHVILDPDKVSEFWRLFMEDLGSVSAYAFPEDSIARTRLHLEDALHRAKETLSGLASKVGYFQLFENGPEGEDRFLHMLRHVNHASLQDLMDRFLCVDRINSVLLLPAKDENGERTAEVTEDSLRGSAVRRWERCSDRTPQSRRRGGRTEPKLIDLGSGRSLILLPDTTLPYASLDLVWKGGDLLLPRHRQGLADLTARILPRGTGGVAPMNSMELQEFLADRAASLLCDARRDLFCVRTKFPTRFSAEILDTFEELLATSPFDSEEVSREKANQLAAIRSREDRPLTYAFRRLYPFLFRKGPYSYLHLGDPADVRAFTRDDAVALWDRQRVMPWTMAVCGDFDRDLVENTARSLAARFDTKESAQHPRPEWNEERFRELRLEDRNQAHLFAVFPVPDENHPDAPGLELLREVLAGQGGLLFRDLRDGKGLGYTVTAFLWQTPVTGFMAFYIGTSPDKLDRAREGFHDAARRLSENILPEEELHRARNLLWGDYYRETQSLSSRSFEAALLTAQGHPLDHRRKTIEKTQNLTAEDLRRIAAAHFNWDGAYFLQVAP